MGAITGTLLKGTEFAGNKKLIVVTAPVASASDTITLTQATHGITAIEAIVGVQVYGTPDAAFLTAHVTFSGLVLTVVSKGADGLASSEWTDTNVSISLIGTL